MLIILSGPSGIGKSYTINTLITKYNFTKIVAYTTREPRKNEINGKEYHFVTESYLREKTNNFKKGYWSYHLSNWYGLMPVTKDISEKNYIIDAQTGIALNIKKDIPEAKLIFLDYKSTDRFITRMKKRNYELGTIIQRAEYANMERQNKRLFDYKFKSDNPNIFVDQIIKLTS